MSKDSNNTQNSEKQGLIPRHISCDLASLNRDIASLEKALNIKFVGRRVTARPNSQWSAKKQNYRDGVINAVYIIDGEIAFSLDWYKKDGSGDFHDCSPAWYRTFIAEKNISHISPCLTSQGASND